MQAPPDHQRLRLIVAYDGSAYTGWQVQRVGTGVQEVLEAAVRRLLPGVDCIHGSSRTDTGVHALGMVAHLDVPRSALRALPPRKLPLALNAHLPPDIRVFSARRMPPDFHARFSATGKQYRYFVWNHPAMNPLLRHQAWHVRRRLDVGAMQAAAPALVGRHDFRSFAATHSYEVTDTVRTLTRCTLRRSGPLLTFRLEGDGFLYKMCRGIVGTLVQVGEGKLAPGDLPRILAGRDRRVGGMNAPAAGLVLWRVFYPPARRRSQPSTNA